MHSYRKTRNQSEKRRRDAFNKLLFELTGIVADGDRKMDKSHVLKQAIAFLRRTQKGTNIILFSS